MQRVLHRAATAARLPPPRVRAPAVSVPGRVPRPPSPPSAAAVEAAASAAPHIAALSHRYVGRPRPAGLDAVAVSEANTGWPGTLAPKVLMMPQAFSTLVVRLRTGEKRDKRAVRADGNWLPSVFQTRGIDGCGDAEILVPFQPILDDYQAGLFCMSRNGRVRLDGPLYHVAFASDADAAAAGWAHSRGILRNVTVLPTRDAPGGASLVAAPLAKPARIRVPVRVRGIDRCPGLTEGKGWLNHLTQAVDLRVEPGVAAPLWVTVDVGGLHMKGRVTIADIGTAEGVRVVGDPTTIVAVISK